MTSGKFVELPDARKRVSVHGHNYCKIILKKLLSFNSSVMDDNHDTYKTANIKINQLFLNA
jgi:hypothetical protein